ncbi:MAG TPA: iron ABC transporter permease [Alphaproteobacteria bacterium]|jgi:iron(III) transport system permease protein|nr:iron ABC transporter permease [Alphaproteobacteria bacterium]
MASIVMTGGLGNGRFARWRGAGVGPWLVAILVLLAVITPLLFLILGSFSIDKLPNDFSLSRVSLDNYRKVWLDPDTYAVVLNTVIYVIGATTIGISVAATLAWLVERTNIPGKAWIYAGVPMILVMPGMLQAMAYVLLLSPRIGFINKLIGSFGLGPLNIYSLTGMIFMEGLRLVPTAFLMLVPLLRSMDPTLEEAAAISGARPVSMLRKITLRLVMPGLIAVAIYQTMTALEAFEIPGILGLPGRVYVFSTRVYSIVNATDGIPNYGEANALSVVYILFALTATYFYARVIARSERYSIVSGKAYRPREIDLGALRWPAVGFVVAFLLISAILPLIALLYISFLPYVQQPSAAAFRAMSLVNYQSLFESDRIGKTLHNTAILVIATSTLTLIVSVIVSMVVVRSKFWGRRILDQLAFVPHAIPGIVMGIAFLWLFLKGRSLGVDLFGTVWAVVIAFTVNFLAYGTRAMNAAILQVHKDLEEAAHVSGAPRWRTMRRIFIPLLMPSLVGVWIYSMLQSVRQAGMPLMLTEGSKNEVLSVLVWRLWNQGEIGVVGALGSILIVIMLMLTLVIRALGFRRGTAVQQTAH